MCYIRAGLETEIGRYFNRPYLRIVGVTNKRLPNSDIILKE
jgi:hypothetical protein